VQVRFFPGAIEATDPSDPASSHPPLAAGRWGRALALLAAAAAALLVYAVW